jgi:hypothetical protein
MKLRIVITTAALALAVGAAALGGASSSEAAPKPGLTPGTWQGTGAITGSVTDEVGTTTFSGKIAFRITIGKNLSVSGKGSWVKQMVGKGDGMSSSMTGIGLMYFGESPQGIKITYLEDVEGTVTINGLTHPVKFSIGTKEDRVTRLVVGKAYHCSASGVIPAGPGLKMTWKAKRLGKCSQ